MDTKEEPGKDAMDTKEGPGGDAILLGEGLEEGHGGDIYAQEES